MPIIEEECKHCIPVWKLTKLMAYPVVLETLRARVIPRDRPGGAARESWKVGVELRWTACLEDLRCAPHRRGWEDPPNLVPPARPRPTIYPKLYLPPFRAHPKYPEAGALAVGPGINASPDPNAPDITGGFLPGNPPITFEGQIDTSQYKVCCKPDVGFPNPATPPSQLKSCCSAKRDIICGCYVQGGGKTTADECCIAGIERYAFSYFTEQDGRSFHDILNHTQPGPYYIGTGDVIVPGFAVVPGTSARSPLSPKQIISDTIEKALRVAAGAGPLGVRNCTTQSGDPKRFNPPEPSFNEYPDWSTRCICLGDGGNEKCP